MEVEVMKRSYKANIDYTGIWAMHRALMNRRLHTAAIVCSILGQPTRPSLTSTRKSRNYIRLLYSCCTGVSLGNLL